MITLHRWWLRLSGAAIVGSAVTAELSQHRRREGGSIARQRRDGRIDPEA